MDEISIVKPMEKPRYRLIKPLYVNDQYISEDTEIEWTGVPNEQMEPLNEVAVERMKAYLSTLEGGHTPRVEDLMYHMMLKRPKEAADLMIPKAEVNVPQMGNMRVPDEGKELRLVERKVEPRVKKLMGTVVQEKQGGPSL